MVLCQYSVDPQVALIAVVGVRARSHEILPLDTRQIGSRIEFRGGNGILRNSSGRNAITGERLAEPSRRIDSEGVENLRSAAEVSAQLGRSRDICKDIARPAGSQAFVVGEIEQLVRKDRSADGDAELISSKRREYGGAIEYVARIELIVSQKLVSCAVNQVRPRLERDIDDRRSGRVLGAESILLNAELLQRVDGGLQRGASVPHRSNFHAVEQRRRHVAAHAVDA